VHFLQRFKRPSLNPEDTVIREDYLRHFENGMNRSTPLREIEFVVLDTETTGLDIKKDVILSIAAIQVKGFHFNLSNRLEAFVQRENYQTVQGVQVHGILSRHMESALPEKEVLTQLLTFLGDRIIVGHHIAFDIGILNKALQKHFHLKLQNKSIDTGKLAQRVENPMHTGGRSNSLDKLCAQYHIPLGQRHTAAGDTFITTLLFLKLLGKLELKKVNTLKTLL
jgi:DNA polymerase-3 subunit epsilon